MPLSWHRKTAHLNEHHSQASRSRPINLLASFLDTETNTSHVCICFCCVRAKQLPLPRRCLPLRSSKNQRPPVRRQKKSKTSRWRCLWRRGIISCWSSAWEVVQLLSLEVQRCGLGKRKRGRHSAAGLSKVLLGVFFVSRIPHYSER